MVLIGSWQPASGCQLHVKHRERWRVLELVLVLVLVLILMRRADLVLYGG